MERREAREEQEFREDRRGVRKLHRVREIGAVELRQRGGVAGEEVERGIATEIERVIALRIACADCGSSVRLARFTPIRGSRRLTCGRGISR